MKFHFKLNPIFKEALKNYFLAYKFFFVPLGTAFLALIIGISTSLPIINDAINNLQHNFFEASSDLYFESKNLLESVLVNLEKELIFNTTNSSVINKNFVENIILNCLEKEIANFNDVSVNVASFLQEAVTSIFIANINLIVWLLIGIFSGFFLLKFLLRRKMARRSFTKFLLIYLIDAILTTTIVAFIIYLIRYYLPSGIISTILIILVYGFLYLFEAYLVHGYKKINIKDILKVEYVVWLFASNIAIIAITSVLTLICSIIFKELAGFIIGLNLFIIALIVSSLNVESFVKQKIANNS